MNIYSFIGLNKNFKFLYSYEFYLSILAAQLFYALLFVLNVHRISINVDTVFFINQLNIALFEEMIFRGFVLGFFLSYTTKRLYSLSFANILTAFVFAMFHLFNHPALWAMLTFIPGLIFGYFREKYSIYPAVILHFIYNVEYFLLF
jgi:membrane protease YdiL (CAAX protease family)